MNFLRLSTRRDGNHVRGCAEEVFQPASELTLTPAFHDPGARRGCKKNDHAEPIAERMQQPENQASHSNSKCNDAAADDEELPEDAHLLERQTLRHDCAELFCGNVARNELHN